MVLLPAERDTKRSRLDAGKAGVAPADGSATAMTNMRDNPFWHMFDFGVAAERVDAEQLVPDARISKRPQGSLQTSLLWDKLVVGHKLPSDVVDAVLASWVHQFGSGVAWDLAEARWIADLENWRHFAFEVRRICSEQSGPVLVAVIEPTSEVVFAVTRLVLQQKTATIPALKTDRQMLDQLATVGWRWMEAETWAENDCLVDSLLQVLDSGGVVRGATINALLATGRLTTEERRKACLAARQHLIGMPSLVPRDPYGQPRWDAYLQHHRHADALVSFLTTRFPAGRSPLSSAGATLVVHARYDTLLVPAERLVVCDRPGGRRGPRPELHVFNWTGTGLQGYHYDALEYAGAGDPAESSARDGAEHTISGVGSQGSAPAEATSRLKRRKQDGQGRPTPSSAQLVDLSSPPRQAEAAPIATAASSSSGAATAQQPARTAQRDRARGRGRGARR